MTNTHKVLIVTLLAAVGIWGCSQNSSGSLERIRALESKVNRLDEEFKTAAAARDLYKKKLTAAEETIAQLRQEVDALQVVVKERDELKVQLKSRTAERDQVAGQFDGFRKNLRDLLGQMDAAAKPVSPPVTQVSQPKRPNL
jgi:chromosome segregation ATPase